MKEQLVSFEVAKLAKEKGFKLGIGWHGIDDMFYYQDVEGGELTENHRGDNLCAPTQSLLQRWLRDVHKLEINIPSDMLGYGLFIIDRVTLNRIPLSNNNNIFQTYEQALEEGLKEALKDII